MPVENLPPFQARAKLSKFSESGKLSGLATMAACGLNALSATSSSGSTATSTATTRKTLAADRGQAARREIHHVALQARTAHRARRRWTPGDRKAHHQRHRRGLADLEAGEGELIGEGRQHFRRTRGAALGDQIDVVEGEERENRHQDQHQAKSWQDIGQRDVPEHLPAIGALEKRRLELILGRLPHRREEDRP